MNVLIYLLIGVLVIVSALMILVVLMQRPKNEGLGASFGSGMTQDLFGAQTTNVLQKFTVYLGGAFFAVCLLLTILYAKASTKTSDVQKGLEQAAKAQAVEAAKTTPAPATSVTPMPVETVTPPIATLTPAATTPAPVETATSPAAISTPEASATATAAQEALTSATPSVAPSATPTP
ncbi:MAG TPA: preprotein translocase subunit SecG [Chthoniobacterales bacterium]